jgi:glutaminyl-peptide cyclotransferase
VFLSLALLAVACGCSQQQKSEAKPAEPAASNSASVQSVSMRAAPDAAAPTPAVTAPKIDPTKAMEYTRQAVAFGPRPIGSAAHAKLQAWIRKHLKNDNLEEDKFTAETPDGKFEMTNFIAKFPGTKDGIVVIAGHYDTKIMKGFVGANDGGSSTGLPLELADVLRAQKEGRPTVWIVLFDGEEAVKEWSDTDSTYGSRHLAQKWQQEGILPKIKALLLVDMVGDKDLDILRDTYSTSWLEDMVQQAASKLGYADHFFAVQSGIEDDHIPFVKLGVPSADLIDFDYGPNNSYWHTTKDTIDKLSAKSLGMVGDTVLQVVWDMK